jgi:hypothetical protein
MGRGIVSKRQDKDFEGKDGRAAFRFGARRWVGKTLQSSLRRR